MQRFQFNQTEIDGLIEITPFCAMDRRGHFVKDFSTDIFLSAGIDYQLKEVFYASSISGVIRGIHFQREKQQAKLVRCICGKIFDVVVDLRKGSPSFQKWLGFDLNEKNQKELLIPEGCGHGYLVLKEAYVSYKCSQNFCAQYDDGIRWDDPVIAVNWPLELVGGKEKVILSDKDLKLHSFLEFMETCGGF